MSELRVKSTGTIKLFESDNTSSVTIASPASLGADRTITLPDASVTLASGTMLATDGDGSGLSGVGKILQVVSSNLTTQMTSSSTSYVDTGLTATITPSATSSKVLVLCNVSFSYSGDNNGYLILLRDTTEINSGSGGTVNAWAGINSNATAFYYSAAQQACNYLDSPSTTSATTYKVQTKSANASYSVAINRRAIDTHFGMTSNITLLEVGV